MSYSVNDAPQRGVYSVTLAGGTATGAASVAAIPNPEGVDLILDSAYLAVTANSTGATNLTIGTAASGTVAATSMLAATAMAAAAGSVLALTAHGTAVGAEQAKWGSADYINVASSASSAGLAAQLNVRYIRI
jgi:hypothetical protein